VLADLAKTVCHSLANLSPITYKLAHSVWWWPVWCQSHVGGCASRLRQRSSPHAPCVLPSATEPSRRLLHLFGTVCRISEDWRLNFLSGLTAVLPHERLTVLTTTWPHITVTCPCSPRTLCHVKLIRYHHHHHHLPRAHCCIAFAGCIFLKQYVCSHTLKPAGLYAELNSNLWDIMLP